MSPDDWVLAVLWVWQIKYVFNYYRKFEDFYRKNNFEISEVLWKEKSALHPSFFPTLLIN